MGCLECGKCAGKQALVSEVRISPVVKLSKPTRVSIMNRALLEGLVKKANASKEPCDYAYQLMSNSPERAEAVLRGKVVPPYEVEIQPSSICNVRCGHCFGKDYKRLPNKLGDSEMRIVVDRIAEFTDNGFSTEVIKFCGTTGEPLVNPAIRAGITRAKELGKKVIVFSNGVLINRYVGDLLGVDKINLSLDAGTPETFRNLKGVDKFGDVINGLGYLLDKRRALGQNNPRVIASYVIGEKNLEDVDKVPELMSKLGVDDMLFRVDFTNLRWVKDNLDKIRGKLDTAKSYSRPGFNVRAVYENEDLGKNGGAFSSYKFGCYNHNFWACVGPDAELYFCGHRTHGGVESCGSLLDHTMRDLWVSHKRKALIATLPDGNCRVCSPSSRARNEIMSLLAYLGMPAFYEAKRRILAR
jgi:MoaA/NifB/PqqE/SkfB family radical SAM enzyme